MPWLHSQNAAHQPLSFVNLTLASKYPYRNLLTLHRLAVRSSFVESLRQSAFMRSRPSPLSEAHSLRSSLP